MTDDELTRARWRICDPTHAHYSESGRMTGKLISLFGKSMAELTLENCQHGGGGCFVQRHQIMIDPLDPKRPRPRRLRRER